jgi:RimJ/RimL family protein N-acetyltransferase
MILTDRLQLVPCTAEYVAALIYHPQVLEQTLEMRICDRWTEFPEALEFTHQWLTQNPSVKEWAPYLFIHQQDRKLIGWGGFKGKPNAAGLVEIGYEITADYQGQGLATEAAQGLLDFAFAHPEVQAVEAHTLAEHNPSTRILEKLGMRSLGVEIDPNDGEVWRWQIQRNDYQPEGTAG